MTDYFQIARRLAARGAMRFPEPTPATVQAKRIKPLNSGLPCIGRPRCRWCGGKRKKVCPARKR